MDQENSDISGHVIVVMAPMGSGKGTLISRALETYPAMEYTVSCTSRAPRPGEEDGVHYHFISREEFNRKIAAGDFIEWAEFAGNKYGTLKSEILPRLQNGKVVMTEIELQGVEQLLKLLPKEHLTIVYIDAGGWEILKERAQERAPMTEEELAKRYERFLVEQQAMPIADIVITNNKDIEVAHAAFAQVVDAAYERIKS